MPLTPIAEFENLGENDEVFRHLADICKRHNGLWNVEAENYLLSKKAL
jgi:hypothetical protein